MSTPGIKDRIGSVGNQVRACWGCRSPLSVLALPSSLLLPLAPSGPAVRSVCGDRSKRAVVAYCNRILA